MGTYRLFLAILVALNHIDVTLYGFRMGSVAVVSFFLLSGFVMTALVRKHYNRGDKIPSFYLDRVMRLFPQFLFYMVLTLVLIAIAHPTSVYISDLNVTKVLLNFLMLPLGFYMFGLFESQIIPQAWSLGLELMFYLAIPIILIYRLRWPVFILSVVIFCLARLQIIDAQYFSYRLLPGTLFLFLCGSFLQYNQGKRDKILIATTYIGAMVMLFIVLFHVPMWQTDYNRQVLFGLVLGLPIVVYLSKRTFGPLDDALGNISYGVFLNHFFIIWSFQCLGMDINRIESIILLIITSMLLAWASYHYIERPVIALRYKLRSKPPFGSQKLNGLAMETTSTSR